MTGADFKKGETRIKPLGISLAWRSTRDMRGGNQDLHQHGQQSQHPRKVARAILASGYAVAARHKLEPKHLLL